MMKQDGSESTCGAHDAAGVVGVDSAFTAEVKNFALAGLKADLVGVANIERFANAPLMMSPQGIMPAARSVVVMAVHHPDACIELGGLTHPQEIGPYRVQYWMNSRLDEMAYRLAIFLQDRGWGAVPIVSSNIWRYKGYKDLTEHFAPDLSHRHAAVAAGVAEFGVSGLAITPEYGARQRFITVVTDAELDPTPLLEPGSVCDGCMLCAKHCRSGAMTKELSGWKTVAIEDKEYRYLHKNLWRCSWGEHFDLDLDLPIPEKVDEDVILATYRAHGVRGGEMGSCLRYCVPKELRYFDAAYTDAPRRRRHVSPADNAGHRGLFEKLRSSAARWGVDFVIAAGVEEMEGRGVCLKDFLPSAVSAVTFGVRCPALGGPAGAAGDRGGAAARYMVIQAAYDACRLLEAQGFDAVTGADLAEEEIQAHIQNAPADSTLHTMTVLTDAAAPTTGWALPEPTAAQPRRIDPHALTADLKRLAKEFGSSIAGAAPASRLEPVAETLAGVFDGAEVFDAVDKGGRFTSTDVEIHSRRRKVHRPTDYVSRASSVMVFGLPLPAASVDITARTPAEAVGPYAYAQYEVAKQLGMLAFRAVRLLRDRGFHAEVSFDLLGTGGLVGNPHGEQPDIFCNRFAAVAAGLGRLSRCGFVVTPAWAANVRFVAVVTDAELDVDDVLADDALVGACRSCTRCVDACPTGAFGPEVEVEIDGARECFHRIDPLRCDWAKRHTLIGDAGSKYLGWELNVEPPATITSETLTEALGRKPLLKKHHPCNFEMCMMACPYARPQ